MTGNESISQNGLVAKTPSRSRTCVEYKFSTDYVLREQYRNPWNKIRMGKLVEDLDFLCKLELMGIWLVYFGHESSKE
ncbi:Acyl-coenzyme A thioesterase 9 mitochondrial [Bienertia sinuspersici]